MALESRIKSKYLENDGTFIVKIYNALYLGFTPKADLRPRFSLNRGFSFQILEKYVIANCSVMGK